MEVFEKAMNEGMREYEKQMDKFDEEIEKLEHEMKNQSY